MFVKIKKKKKGLCLYSLQATFTEDCMPTACAPGHGNWRVDPPARRTRATQNKFKNMNV